MSTAPSTYPCRRSFRLPLTDLPFNLLSQHHDTEDLKAFDNSTRTAIGRNEDRVDGRTVMEATDEAVFVLESRCISLGSTVEAPRQVAAPTAAGKGGDTEVSVFSKMAKGLVMASPSYFLSHSES